MRGLRFLRQTDIDMDDDERAAITMLRRFQLVVSAVTEPVASLADCAPLTQKRIRAPSASVADAEAMKRGRE